MGVILAVDPAWTIGEPSGVALIVLRDAKWRCVALAPDYAQFFAFAEGKAIDWSSKPTGAPPDIDALFQASTILSGGEAVTLITVDMPVSTHKITGRRKAENAIASAFGGRGCAAHSPIANRPGLIADTYYQGVTQHGFALATTATTPGEPMHLLEVYPHPALLTLLDAEYRIPYKVSRRGRYWPDLDNTTRKSRLLAIYTQILTALGKYIADIPLTIPDALLDLPFSHFKRYEDALDALICAWIGIEYLSGNATAYGDNSAAIWVPG